MTLWSVSPISFLDSRAVATRIIRVYRVGLCNSDMFIVFQLWIKLVEMVRDRRALVTYMWRTGRSVSAQISGSVVRRVGFGCGEIFGKWDF
jgi:hypothetical protein